MTHTEKPQAVGFLAAVLNNDVKTKKNCFSPTESSSSGHDQKPLHYKAYAWYPHTNQ